MNTTNVNEVQVSKFSWVPGKTQQLSSCTLTRLDPDEQICLLGYGELRVVYGSVEAFGALLHPSIDFTSLLLPFSSPALPLKCGTQSVTSDNCTTNEESEAIKSLLQNAPVGCSVIAWRRLQRALPMPAIFTDRSHCEDPTSQNLSFEGFHFIFHPSCLPCLVIPPQWYSAAKQVCDASTIPAIIICGKQGSGKSTFSRFLLNRLLCKFPSVCYIDLDTGQPEFSPPCLISAHILTCPVFGPSFTHSKHAERAIFTGDITPQADPEYYVQCVGSLLQWSRAVVGSMPVIVNTNGWTNGVGRQMQHLFIQWSNPTYLIHLEKNVHPSKRLLPGDTSELATSHACNDRNTEAASELRNIPCSFISVLQHLFPSQDTPVTLLCVPQVRKAKVQVELTAGVIRDAMLGSHFENSAVSLTQRVPYIVPWASVAIGFLVKQVPPSQSLVALNGSVVALCISDGTTEYLPSGRGPIELPDFPVFIFGTPPPLPCVGLGIDVTKKQFLIATAVPAEKLAAVNVLLKGRPLDTPDSTAVAFVPTKGALVNAPYFAWNSLTGALAAPMKAKKYLHRK